MRDENRRDWAMALVALLFVLLAALVWTTLATQREVSGWRPVERGEVRPGPSAATGGPK